MAVIAAVEHLLRVRGPVTDRGVIMGTIGVAATVARQTGRSLDWLLEMVKTAWELEERGMRVPFKFVTAKTEGDA